MGEVFSGHVRATDERVAIKFLRSDLSSDPTLIARFVRERQILTGVSNPHLVALRDLVIEGDQLAIVMDLVDGSDLRTWAGSRGRIGQRTATDLCMQLLEALAAMHAHGIVHRDVKPENVLLEDEGAAVPFVKLGDFGIAGVAEGPLLARRSGMIGTPLYMAPELASNEPIGAAADLLFYAAGPSADEFIYPARGYLGNGLKVAPGGGGINGSYVRVAGRFEGDCGDVFLYGPGTSPTRCSKPPGTGPTDTRNLVTVHSPSINGVYTPVVFDADGDGRADIFFDGGSGGTESIMLGT